MIRAKMRPSDPDGFREAWAILERLWKDTVRRARGLDPDGTSKKKSLGKNRSR